jgi:transposase
MIQITPHMRIYVAHQAVDFRKGIDGIVRVCRDKLTVDPFSGALFIFRNKRQTGIKIIVYHSQGFWLCHKRLSVGRLKWWPKPDDDSHSANLESHELQTLIAGGNPSKAKCPEAWKRITSIIFYERTTHRVPLNCPK